MINEWLKRQIDRLQQNSVPEDAILVELEDTLLAHQLEDDFEICEQAQKLRELLLHGCFPLNEIRQFFEGGTVNSNNLERQLKQQVDRVANSALKAFIAQSFWDASEDIYEDIIKPSCYWEAIYPIRMDKRTKESSLIEKIKKGFDEANLFIADLYENNQNVFYEIGYFEAKEIQGLFLSYTPEDSYFYTKFKDIIQVEKGLNGVSNTRKKLREALRSKKALFFKQQKIFD